MFTIKQMEALYWVATLGSFEAEGCYPVKRLHLLDREHEFLLM